MSDPRNHPSYSHRHDDPWDVGMAADAELMAARPVARRRVLGMFFGAGAAAVLAACGSNDKASNDKASNDTASNDTAGSTSLSSTVSSDSTASSVAATNLTKTPAETAGPYPGDGSNGPNVLADQAVVRRDITTSFGDYSGTASGVPTAISLKLVDAATGVVKSGAAVYLWHCTNDGKYSLYTDAEQNYLRGVQAAGADGVVSFDSIFPGCYSGRWPHIHFEVYPSVDAALAATGSLLTSQIAIPEDACKLAYTADGYQASVTNLSRTSLASDNVFRDGWDHELGTAGGSVADGFTIHLDVAV